MDCRRAIGTRSGGKITETTMKGENMSEELDLEAALKFFRDNPHSKDCCGNCKKEHVVAAEVPRVT